MTLAAHRYRRTPITTPGGVFIFIPRALQYCSHNEQDAAGNDRLSGRSSGPCRRQAGRSCVSVGGLVRRH